MLRAVDIVPCTASSWLPTKSWVWLVIGKYLTRAKSTQMQAVSRDFYEVAAPHRLCQAKLELRLPIILFV